MTTETVENVNIANLIGPLFSYRVEPFDSMMPLALSWRTFGFEATRTVTHDESANVLRVTMQLKNKEGSLKAETGKGCLAFVNFSNKDRLDEQELKMTSVQLLNGLFLTWIGQWVQERIHNS